MKKARTNAGVGLVANSNNSASIPHAPGTSTPNGSDPDNGLTRQQFTHGFVGPEKLLEELFPDESVRPSVYWLRDQRVKRLIPYQKLGQKIFYSPAQVHKSIEDRFTIRAKGGNTP